MAEKKIVEKPKTIKEEPKVTAKPKAVPKVAPAPKQPTLKEKIDRTVEDYKDNSEELKKQLFGLVQRVLYPNQFCPECNDRLFLNGQAYSCMNCGYNRALTTPAPVANPTLVTPAVNVPAGQRPSTVAPVPPEVEAAISGADEAMKDAPRRGGTTKMGAKIQKLVAERDAGGPQTVTAQDEAKVKRDPNASNKINWV